MSIIFGEMPLAELTPEELTPEELTLEELTPGKLTLAGFTHALVDKIISYISDNADIVNIRLVSKFFRKFGFSKLFLSNKIDTNYVSLINFLTSTSKIDTSMYRTINITINLNVLYHLNIHEILTICNNVNEVNIKIQYVGSDNYVNGLSVVNLTTHNFWRQYQLAIPTLMPKLEIFNLYYDNRKNIDYACPYLTRFNSIPSYPNLKVLTFIGGFCINWFIDLAYQPELEVLGNSGAINMNILSTLEEQNVRPWKIKTLILHALNIDETTIPQYIIDNIEIFVLSNHEVINSDDDLSFYQIKRFKNLKKFFMYDNSTFEDDTPSTDDDFKEMVNFNNIEEGNPDGLMLTAKDTEPINPNIVLINYTDKFLVNDIHNIKQFLI